MSLAQLQAFIGHLRQNKVFEQSDIIRIVKQMVQIDRRIGLLAVSRGYLKPEQVNAVLNVLLNNIQLKFGEVAMQLQYMTQSQVDEMLKLQQNDLSLFSQAAILARVAPPDRMAGILKDYLKAAPPDEPLVESKERVATGRKVREVLSNVKTVAALPGPAQKILAMLQDPDVDVDQVAKVVSVEPTLVALILKIVNSAFYGLRSRITTVTQAMVVLGLKKIRQVILTAGVMDKFQNIPTQQALKIWDHSIHAGQWAKEIGMALTFKETEEMFISGLVHNVGELIVIQYFPAEYRQITSLIEKGTPQIEAERRSIGGTHADLAAFTFETWQLSTETIQSAMFHHHPLGLLENVQNLSKHALILNLSVSLADMEGTAEEFEIMAKAELAYEPYKALLGNRDVDMGRLYGRVNNAVKELKRIFA